MTNDSTPDETEDDTKRVPVTTYVPAYQKAHWKDHADRLGMNQSEFVRCMVQAGRRGFNPQDETIDDAEGEEPEDDSDEVRERVLTMLDEVEYLTYDELVALFTADIEADLEEALLELQAENKVLHGRDGYVLAADE